MMTDLLGDILAALSFRELNITEFQLRAPWAISTDGFRPGFNLILVEGSCWISLLNGRNIRLTAGQSILLPRGGSIKYASDPKVSAAKLTDLWDEAQFHPLSDFPAVFFEKAWGGDGAKSRFLGFAFELAETVEERVLPSLPDVILLDASEQASHLVQAFRTYLAGGQTMEPGEFAIRARFAEGIVIEQLRRHILSSGYETGWIAGIRHPKLQTAIALIHKRFDEQWSLETLAKACGMSRASFAKEFCDITGQPPITYLNDVRVHKARTLLMAGKLSISDIAFRVGFGTEFAMRRNVRRLLGQTPRDIRRDAAQSV